MELPDVELPDAEMPDAAQIEQIAALLSGAQRPVFIAGRGAARTPFDGTRAALEQLAESCGALLATSAAGHGLFAGSPWDLGISGGFATPLAAELIASADVLVAWGCSLNMWTTRHGTLIPPGAAVVRVDHDQVALDQPLIAPVAQDLRVRGELRLVADAVLAASVASGGSGYRTADVRARIEAAGRWRQVPYDDWSTESTIDPRTLTAALDDILPGERVVAIDSGNFMGYPATYLRVPDPAGFSFTQAYQSIGLGLASAIGAAIARPDRLTVAALGDGGFLMALAELTTVRRLGLPLAIVVYNDAAYGAEVHHFGPDGFALDTVTFRGLRHGRDRPWLRIRRHHRTVDGRPRTAASPGWTGRGIERSWWTRRWRGTRRRGGWRRRFAGTEVLWSFGRVACGCGPSVEVGSGLWAGAAWPLWAVRLDPDVAKLPRRCARYPQAIRPARPGDVPARAVGVELSGWP